MSRVITISTDPIADMLSRIRNAAAVNSVQVSMPHSKVKETIAKILATNGFLEGVKVSDENGRKTLLININAEDQSSTVTEIKRLSRPGRRMYVKSPAIPTVRRGRGLVIISTSQGIMTGKEA
jgi:small subunit ribosomal protein S8